MVSKTCKLIYVFGLISLFFISCSLDNFIKNEEEEITLSSLSVMKEPTKTSYLVGEKFDKSGMIVKAYYSDFSNKEVTNDVIITGFDSSKEDLFQKITVEYTEKKISKTSYFYIKIKEPEVIKLSSISVTKEPTKTSYIIGEEFDKKGMIVKAYYSDFSNKEVTENVKISGFDSSKEDSFQKITVEYNDNGITKTDYFYISIKEPEAKIEYEITYKNVESWVNSIGTTRVQVIVEIQNTGKIPIYLSSSSYDLEDSTGKLIAAKSLISTYPNVIKSGEKGYMYDETSLENAIEGKLNVIPRISAKKATVACIRYEVSEITISDTSYLGPKMIGRIENTTSEDENRLIYVVAILFNSQKEPIGILTDLIYDDLPAGSKMGFEATSLSLPKTVTTSTIDSYLIYAYPNQYQF